MPYILVAAMVGMGLVFMNLILPKEPALGGFVGLIVLWAAIMSWKSKLVSVPVGVLSLMGAIACIYYAATAPNMHLVPIIGGLFTVFLALILGIGLLAALNKD